MGERGRKEGRKAREGDLNVSDSDTPAVLGGKTVEMHKWTEERAEPDDVLVR